MEKKLIWQQEFLGECVIHYYDIMTREKTYTYGNKMFTDIRHVKRFIASQYPERLNNQKERRTENECKGT